MGSAERWRPTDLAMFNRPNVSMLGFYRRGFLALLLALAAYLVLRWSTTSLGMAILSTPCFG